MTEFNISSPIHEALAWPTPLSLTQSHDHPYPIEALPTIIKNAVLSYQQYGQQPISLIACSALANVSLACQTLANIARDRWLISPLSLYFLIVAGSGERKSAADHTFSQAIRRWEQEVRANLAPEVQVAETLYRAWHAEKEGILAQIRREALRGNDTHLLKQQFIFVMDNQPQIPLLPTLFYEDATQEALASNLACGWPTASLWSDEGGIVLSSHGMQNNTTQFVALLNRLWDGKAFIAHRKTTPSFTVENRRLTVNLMLQPLLLQQMLTKKEGIARQSGFLARSIMTYPASGMGERFYKEPPEYLTKALPAFHQRIMDCLNESLGLDQKGCHDIPTLSFSPSAKSKWITFFNAVEAGLKKASAWFSIKDFASKSAENAARLAALFHLFAGKTGSIDSESIEQAIQIIEWHLLETRRILEADQHARRQQNVIKLLNWITEKALTQTTRRHLQQYGPIRDKSTLDRSIQHLIESHHLREIKEKGATFLFVNPALC